MVLLPLTTRETKQRIFLCYCHKDRLYAERLRVHFACCSQPAELVIWDASRLPAGSLWKDELTHALMTTTCAVLLVSADFLASSFITSYELPRLLDMAQAGGTRILPVILRPCLFEESSLAPFQAVNSPARPMSSLSNTLREEVWVSVVRQIIRRPQQPQIC
jgi:TIR domain